MQLTVTYSGKAAMVNQTLVNYRKFEIISNSRQQQLLDQWQTNVVNRWNILLPKKQGRLTIPALNFNGDNSKSIGIVV